ncbi:DUF2892 domain-containing protein [Candidatus Parcubacteria bacterium]|uniref:DUF2892 domain-containing protein n=1 Tax=Candidatus Magasanikbacteria bacterium CG10_big_fil_rev_8_21_14_0_10_38_6 TaxID=1974647 RepID=A0A2M6P176_9BACT|nr:DUF2892 domain-containing protein [Candidatus Parcubacteria bacterium]PIR77466.1 MAG: hypothetical protein COU30_02325 [Candidatus Magasanikbacteria bacterium CG10_big_fil_rev_8_21_14_0_10_38_6]
MKHISRTHWQQAPVLRVLFCIAGIIVIAAVLLGYYVHSGFFFLAIVVGFMQIVFSITGWCPMAIVLQLFGLPCTVKK